MMVEAWGLLFNFTVGELIPWLGWINRLNGCNAKLDRIGKMRDAEINYIIEEHMMIMESSSDGGDSNFVDNLLAIYKGNTPGCFHSWNGNISDNSRMDNDRAHKAPHGDEETAR